MRDDDSPWGCITAVAGALAVCVMVAVISYCEGRKAEHQKAIAAGVGRYVADPATGKITFVYSVPSTVAPPPMSGK